tara:strand:+ start:902 stop:1045 length:144 start_codon:yes stop_codon:yes gene_type:complete
MFNIEFNKKFEGSLNLPLQSSKFNGPDGKGQSMANSYLVFITDDHDS